MVNLIKFYKKRNIINYLLLPISYIYYLFFYLRKIFANPINSKIPIICIGNIYMGGAGKTPIAIALSKLLKKNNYNFVFLSKGYSGKLTGPLEVYPNIHDAKMVGDEPLLLANYGKVIIAKNRKSGINFANKYNVDYIIMDDGFQNPTINKDFSILVFDGNLGIGNNMLLPAGLLRQTLKSAIKKSDINIIIGDDEQNLGKVFKDKLIKVKTDIILDNIENNYVAFAALANNEKFFKSLEKKGCNLLKKIDYIDHYLYKERDILELFNIADNLDAKLITTEKDLVKIDKKYHNQILISKINISFLDEEKILKLLEGKIDKKN